MADYLPCPKCNSTEAEKVKYTWWGGVLGPKLLHHVKCTRCGSKYNGKTGKSNTVGILVYSIIAVFIVFLILFAIGIIRLQ